MSPLRPALAWLALSAGSAMGQDAPAAAPAAEASAGPPLACMAQGYDVVLTNDGTEAMAKGTEVDWYVPFARMRGTHPVDRDVGPGERYMIVAVLGSSYLGGNGRPCEAAVKPAAE
jgi:hypothetical protein